MVDVDVRVLLVKVALFIPEHFGVVPGAFTKPLLSWLDSHSPVVHLERELVVLPSLLFIMLTAKTGIGEAYSDYIHYLPPRRVNS